VVFYKKNVKHINLAAHHPGYAIGIDRNLFHNIGGFYDRAVIGSGDTLFWNGILNTSDIYPCYDACQTNPHIKNYDFEGYYEILKNNKAYISLGCVANNMAVHLQHGSAVNRKYRSRYLTVPTYNYKLSKNCDNVYEWETKELDVYMRKYFASRMEDE